MMIRWLSITALVVATTACSALDTGTPPPDAATGGGGGGGGSNQITTTTYEGKLDAITPVAFGGPPTTACNYTQGMEKLQLDLLIKSSGEVIGGAMQNHNVEVVTNPGVCTALPAAPSDSSYTFTGAQTASGTTTITFAGVAGNHPGASLVVKLSSTGTQKYNAALTITRTDLPGTTYTWTVNTTLALAPKP